LTAPADFANSGCQLHPLLAPTTCFQQAVEALDKILLAKSSR